MPVKSKITEESFVNEVCAIPGGEGVRSCIQCGTCSGSCPNANLMDYSPRKLIAMVRAEMREEVLSSNSMWYCASCYLCAVRCPRGVKITELMHALECLAFRHGLTSKRVKTPIVYQSFVGLVKSRGRVHEAGIMQKFYLKSNPFAVFKLAGIGLKMFLRGRLPLRAAKIKRKGEFKAIMDKAHELGETK